MVWGPGHPSHPQPPVSLAPHQGLRFEGRVPRLKKVREWHSPVGPCESGLRPEVPCSTCQSKQDCLWGGVEPQGAQSGLPSSCAHVRSTAVTSALCRPGPCPPEADASYKTTAGDRPGKGQAGGCGEDGDPVEGTREPMHAHSTAEGPGSRLPEVDASPSFLAGWPWESRSASRGVSFLLCETNGGTVVLTSGVCSEGPVRRRACHSSGSPWAQMLSLSGERRRTGTFRAEPKPGRWRASRHRRLPSPGEVAYGPEASLYCPLGDGPAGRRRLRPWAREPGPRRPQGLPLRLPPSRSPRLTLTPVTSTVVPGHLPSRDCPGPRPWGPSSP